MQETKHTRAARWKRLWRLISGCRRYFLYTILATLLAALFAYLSPLVVSFTVDSIVGGKEMNLPGWLQGWIEGVGGREYLAAHLWLPALAVLLVQGLNGVCAYARGRCSAMGGEGTAKALRDALYRRLVRAPYAWHKASSTGDLVQRCTSDVETVRRFLQMQMMEVVRTIVMALVALSIMWPIHRQLTLLACSLLPLLIIFSFFYSRWVQKLFLAADEAEGAMTTALQENLTGMRVVRTFARQNEELEKFTGLNQDYRRKNLRLNNVMGVYWGSSDVMGYLQIALVMLAGVYLAVQGDVSLGTVMLFSTYSSMLTFPMRQLGRILADLVKADVSLKRLDEILTAPQEEEPGRARMEEALLTQLFFYLYRASRQEREKTRLPEERQLQQVIEYMEGHLEEPLSLEELAGRFYMDRYRLSRCFTRQVGCPPHRYLMYKRLQRAALLMEEGRPVSQVPALCGFADYSNFYRRFREYFGVSPREWKKRK